MKIKIRSLLITSMLLGVINSACSQSTKDINTSTESIKKSTVSQTSLNFTLDDFYKENKLLDKEVEAIFSQLDDTAKVAQTLMPAVGRLGFTNEKITTLINKRLIGGVLMLNGTKEEFTKWIQAYEKINAEKGNLPFLYSADAEPTLFNRKISGTPIVKKAAEISTEEDVKICAEIITKELKEIGINYNFAPVVDVSKNKTVGYRGFGAIESNNIPFSNKFIETSQKNGVIATAKHFPGHGLVSGDTHASLQVISGELKEVKNYLPLIKNNVLSVMIGHLAVDNNSAYNTNGLPSTLSKTIVTDLLRKELKFNGLIVTDAMNMGGVASIPNCDLKAIEAGCDIVLMPINPEKSHKEILAKYKSDDAFQKQLDESVKRIIRMKICVGAIN